jgi:PPOX class probable F420-dependent enzyme
VKLATAFDFVRARSQGVVLTIGPDGRPHATNIVYNLGDDDLVRVSVTDSRVKVRNLRRDPRCSLYVVGRQTFWQYAVLDGTAELSAVAKAPDDEVVEELVALYVAVLGEEHPNWPEFRQAMVDEGRLVLRLRPERAYGNAVD